MAKHVFMTPQDCGCDETKDEKCPVCDRGAAQCKVCGGAEGWLTTDCPGTEVPYELGEKVGKDELDYIEGQGWVNKV